MSQPSRPSPGVREPGRSFDDPSRPLGEDLLERSPSNTSAEEGGVYGRAQELGPRPVSVADRAKAIAVLRKADEFMQTDNPSPVTRAAMRRALELAAGRVGMTFDEYDVIVRNDPEVAELERKLLDEAVARVATRH
jgi:hypothetical protein